MSIKSNDEIVERVADAVHDVWANWMKYMLSQGHVSTVNPGAGGLYPNVEQWTMPSEKLKRWTRQMNTPYKELSEEEKESDREIALKYIEMVEIGQDV